MADNTELNPGTGGDVIATDDISNVKHQLVKVEFGADGFATQVSDNNPLPISFGTAARDSFGRFRVSNLTKLFESKQIFDNQPLFWDELLTGSGITSAWTVARASTILTSTASTAGNFIRQTFRRFNYRAGQSTLIDMTGILDPSGGGTGVQRYIGQLDDDNGFYFMDDQGTIKVGCRSSVTGSPVDVLTEQANWNVDTMDGTGPSGLTLDPTKAQIFFFDYEWLGVGVVRFAVGGPRGEPIYVHEFRNANALDSVYMSTPNNPLRYQMITTASSPASTMECMCAAVSTEGDDSPLGIEHNHSTDGTAITLASTGQYYPIVGIRLQAAKVGAMVDTINVHAIELGTNKFYQWALMFNPTISGTFTYGDLTNSAVQTATGVGATTVTGNGIIIASGFGVSAKSGGSGGDAINTTLKLGVDIAGTGLDTLVLAIQPIGGTSGLSAEGSMTWRESQ